MIDTKFVTAGKAIFTIQNPKGERYTFKVTRKESKYGPGNVFFLSLMTGPDNESSYTYMGLLNPETGEIRVTQKGAWQDGSTEVKVARWSLGLLWGNGTLPEGYGLHHAGRCGRCGKTLTVPESIETGFGPECAGRVRS